MGVYTCDNCPLIFPDLKTRSFHEIRNHESVKKEEPCSIDDNIQALLSSETKAGQLLVVKPEMNSNETNPCVMCDKTFQSIGLVQRHVRDCHLSPMEENKEIEKTRGLTGNQESPAKSCGEQDTNESIINYSNNDVQMALSPVKQMQYACDKCERVFNRGSSLKNHIKLSHTILEASSGSKDNVLVTVNANKPFEAISSSAKRAHNKIRRYSCNDCKLHFRDKTDFTRHTDSVHLGLRNFKCENCPKSYGSKGNLNMHIAKEHKTLASAKKQDFDLKQFSVPLKRLSDAEIEEATRPVRKQIKIEVDDVHVCNVCGRIFITNAGLKAHMDGAHPGANVTIAENDNIIAPKTKSVEPKETAVLDKVEEPVTSDEVIDVDLCKKCGRIFTSTRSLSIHDLESHSANVVKSKTLGLAVKKRNGLRKFRNAKKHWKRRCTSFECPKCKKKCSNTGDFNAHVSLEHKGPPYDETAMCNHCDKRFRDGFDLMRHNEGVHLKVYRYKCDKCPKKFAMFNNKKTHERACILGIRNWSKKKQKTI